MPKIIFTATPELPRDIAYLDYKKGDVVMLAPDSCRRWIQRGVAEFYVEPVAPAEVIPALPVSGEADEPDDETEVADPVEDEEVVEAEPEISQKPRRGRNRR